MADKQDAGRYVAEGYSFLSEKDAALAENERRKIDYLESRLDYDHPETILRVYNKAIEERVFKSPVGQFFLRNLQQYLVNQPEIDPDEVSVIPLYVSFDTEFREQPNPARNRINPVEKKKEKKKFQLLPISLIINAGLVVAVIAMFSIALNSDQPNILNYEKAITNRYASWEQQLTEREQIVRERERELNIKSE